MNTWKIILATVVIFAAGVVTGGLLVSHANRASSRPIRRLTNALEAWRPRLADIIRSGEQGPQPPLERQRMEFILAVHRELKLTPDQHRRIEKIVHEGQEKTKAILEKVQPELREQWRETREKIRAELTPKQRARFEELLKQRPARRLEEPPGQERQVRDRRQPLPRPDALSPSEASRPADAGTLPPPNP
jgi:Spy/CpxP family protein refolding chaperone